MLLFGLDRNWSPWTLIAWKYLLFKWEKIKIIRCWATCRWANIIFGRASLKFEHFSYQSQHLCAPCWTQTYCLFGLNAGAFGVPETVDPSGQRAVTFTRKRWAWPSSSPICTSTSDSSFCKRRQESSYKELIVSGINRFTGKRPG